MTKQQQENVAKYLYDLSKIVFATAVVGNLLAGRQFSVVTLIVGAVSGFVFLGWGYFLDGLERRGE